MDRKSCILYPEVNGQPSKLYKDLLNKRKLGRPMANWIYAAYLTSDVAKAMDKKYKRNKQGEHNVDDVWEFLNISKMLSESDSVSLEAIEKTEGAIDSSGNRIDYTDAKEALEIADSINDNYKGLVATVIQNGDVFHIITNQKNATNNTYATGVKERLKVWDIYKQVFNSINVDIENVPQSLKSIFNPMNTSLAAQLKGLKILRRGLFFKKDALTIFSLYENSAPVQRVINAFGSLENAAQALNDWNMGTVIPNDPDKLLLTRAVMYCQKFPGINLDKLQTQVNETIEQTIKDNPEEEIKKTLHRLNKRYNISINEIHRINDKIRTLSDAAAEAAIQLQRQIRVLENQKGNNAEGKRLEVTLNRLMKELACKKYYTGILSFLNEAASQASQIDTMLSNVSTTGTELEQIFAKAKVYQDIKQLRDQYYTLADALSNKNLVIDEAITQKDIDNIRSLATKVKEYFDKKDSEIKTLAEGTMIDLMKEIIGDITPDGQTVVNAVRTAAADSSIMNYLYSIGRSSNPIIGAMGRIIRNAQDSRDARMNDISLRIRRATDKLYKEGYDSKFMYEDSGHIISDIDWGLYKQTRKSMIKSLYKQGLRGFDLKQAIESWEESNTEERVVDAKNGRTERVPDAKYRKDFPVLAKAQKEYYDEMMQLKGEIGSLLPAYAQHQYLPPQLRRSTLDALGQAKDYKDVMKAIKNKVVDKVGWVIREDDTNYNTNGIIDGDEYQITNGEFDNTPLRQIPIFFINNVEEGELLKNFSTGMAALAGTAINYDAMSEVVDTVEFIGDFVKSQIPRDRDAKADSVESRFVRVVKDLRKMGVNTNTAALIDGFISQHVYGQTHNPNENKKWVKFVSNIVGYTSFKGLATNIKGALSNYLVGEFQMLIEAGAGEFYGFKDYAWAHSKLFGGAGIGGEIMELLTNNVNHKGVLFREMFDPVQENFSDKSRQKYYKSMFRQLVAHDCAFIGYASGEYLIHYVNIYAILHNKKVLLDGKEISLYDAFEVTNKKDGNSELKIKNGVTDLDGNPIDEEYLDNIRKTIRYVNQTTHGSMNPEDKGLIHQYWWGKMVMNFRQWMVEHYSRRFRKRYFDASLGMEREGYWRSLITEDSSELWKEGQKKDAIVQFMKDLYTFVFRAQTNWANLDEMQKSNVKRVKSEMTMYIALIGLSFALGEPEDHKKEFWRRWWMYQVRRLILDTEASMPLPQALQSGLTILQSPMAGISTMNSMLYMFYGLTNGDIFKEIQSGPHKGENKYWRTLKKTALPFFKDWEQLQDMATKDDVFKVFDNTPSNH